MLKKKDNNSKQWYNVIAAKKRWEKSDKRTKQSKEIIKAYHKDNVKKVIEESSEGSTSLLDSISNYYEGGGLNSLPLIVGGMHAFCNRSGTNP